MFVGFCEQSIQINSTVLKDALGMNTILRWLDNINQMMIVVFLGKFRCKQKGYYEFKIKFLFLSND